MDCGVVRKASMTTSEQLNDNEPPQYFYKYWGLSQDEDKKFDHLKSLLTERKIFFQTPAEFNDPFECAPYLGSDDETEKYQAYISEHCSMLCLVGRNDCHLMWAHYADMHKGICLQFNGELPFFKEGTHKVNYQAERPRFNRREFWRLTETEKRKVMSDTLLTKPEQWDYEDEWRKIRLNRSAGTDELPPGALTRIILGARISSEHEEKIRNLCRQLEAPPDITKARLSKQKYEIIIE
jgi:hypothetical protein